MFYVLLSLNPEILVCYSLVVEVGFDGQTKTLQVTEKGRIIFEYFSALKDYCILLTSSGVG